MYRTINRTHYEALFKGSYGAKLGLTFESKEKAILGINEFNELRKQDGFDTCEFYIVCVVYNAIIDERGDIVSEVIAKTSY